MPLPDPEMRRPATANGRPNRKVEALNNLDNTSANQKAQRHRFDSILLLETMPVECFEGGGGDLVVCQEYPRQDGEFYARVRIPMSEAARLAEEILAVAAHASGAR